MDGNTTTLQASQGKLVSDAVIPPVKPISDDDHVTFRKPNKPTATRAASAGGTSSAILTTTEAAPTTKSFADAPNKRRSSVPLNSNGYHHHHKSLVSAERTDNTNNNGNGRFSWVKKLMNNNSSSSNKHLIVTGDPGINSRKKVFGNNHYDKPIKENKSPKNTDSTSKKKVELTAKNHLNEFTITPASSLRLQDSYERQYHQRNDVFDTTTVASVKSLTSSSHYNNHGQHLTDLNLANDDHDIASYLSGTNTENGSLWEDNVSTKPILSLSSDEEDENENEGENEVENENGNNNNHNHDHDHNHSNAIDDDEDEDDDDDDDDDGKSRYPGSSKSTAITSMSSTTNHITRTVTSTSGSNYQLFNPGNFVVSNLNGNGSTVPGTPSIHSVLVGTGNSISTGHTTGTNLSNGPDSASVVTIASSTRNRRTRRSIDTNASTSAIPPASLFDLMHHSNATGPLAASQDI